MKTLDTLRLQLFDENEINKCLNVEHRFVCSICVEIFFSIEKLKIHYIHVHGFLKIEERREVEVERPEPPPPNKSKICTVCNLPFKNAKTLSKHVKHVHNKIKAFTCSVCSAKFSRKAAMDVSRYCNFLYKINDMSITLLDSSKATSLGC